MQSKIRFETTSHSRAEPEEKGYLPVVLLGLALVIWFGFQLIQTIDAHSNLIKAFDNQEAQFQNAKKLDASLSALATGTKQLANQGNPNAAQIVKALAQKGINIADPGASPDKQSTKAGLTPEKATESDNK